MKFRYIFFYAVGSDHGNVVIDMKWKERPRDAESIEFIETQIGKKVQKNVCITGWRRIWK